MKKKWITALAVACAIALVVGCSNESDGSPYIWVESITLDKNTLTLEPGLSEKLTATVNPNNADNKTVTWSSSDVSVATVNNDGTVKAVRAGVATISAQSGGKETSCYVTVKLVVSKVALNVSTLTLALEAKFELVATVTPSYAPENIVSWSSSDTKVATVSSGGMVTAHTAGTTTITALADGKEAVCELTIVDPQGVAEHSHYYDEYTCRTCGFSKPYIQGCTISSSGEIIECNEDVWNDWRYDMHLDIPDGVAGIWREVFSGCSGLAKVTIPKSVTRIGDSAFHGCYRLKYVTISNGVRSIGNSVFSGCRSLTSVSIPGSVTSIGSSAFSGCESLTSVGIPDSVTIIGSNAFSLCESLTSVSIPGSVTSIGSSAFSWCTKLKGVTISNGVRSVGSSAFSRCESLTSVNIPGSVTSIGSGAFSGCESLTSVSIPDSVTSIESRVFKDCGRLKEVTIPVSVTSIGQEAFYNGNLVMNVKYGGTKEQWNAIKKGINWKTDSVLGVASSYTITCTDGTIKK